MCTAISFLKKNHYFGRNLDLEYRYHETVTVFPRNQCLPMRRTKALHTHYAMIGMATVDGTYPLYYDATNEHGLSMAGLNFPGNAYYRKPEKDMLNIAPFELIPWLLGCCRNLSEAKACLKQTNLTDVSYSCDYALTPLHWMVSDKSGSLTIEPMKDGLVITENPVGVLTNNPPFDYQMFNLRNYMRLSPSSPENSLCRQLKLKPYSNGMGGIGLPGDMSSASRFVKAVFAKCNSICGSDESEAVSQFFHILDSVSQISGCVKVGDGFEKTVYSSCCTESGIYYYTTYENRQITAVSMYDTDLNADHLWTFPLIDTQQIRWANKNAL